MKKVLVLHLKGLGDWFMFTPFLNILTENCTQLFVLWPSKPMSNLGDFHPQISSSFIAHPGRVKLFVQILKIILEHKITDILITGRSNSLQLIVLRTLLSPICKVYGYDRQLNILGDDIHNSQINAFIVSNFTDCQLATPDAYDLESSYCSASKKILIHPGGDKRNSYRRWPLVRFIELARSLLDNGREIAFILGPDETDMGPKLSEYGFDVITPRDINELVIALKSCGMMICSDSGLGHMAAALDKNVITIFGPADPKHSAPLGAKVCVIATEYAETCCPCVVAGGLRGCEKVPCLSDISVEKVKKHIYMELDKWNA